MDKIEFFSSVPGVAEAFPIKPASDSIPRWIHALREDYIKNKHNPELHLYRCPGIIDIVTTGYIVSTWHDIILETDGQRIKMIIPDEALKRALGKEPTEEHFYDGAIKNMPKKPWSVKSMMKLNTPWHLICPYGIKFLMLPIPYPDEHAFECASGILDPSTGSEINIQGYWNMNAPGRYFIKAGTPVAQLIPITERKFNLEVRDASERDKLWLEKKNYLTFFSFKFNYSKIKSAYSKFFFNK